MCIFLCIYIQTYVLKIFTCIYLYSYNLHYGYCIFLKNIHIYICIINTHVYYVKKLVFLYEINLTALIVMYL